MSCITVEIDVSALPDGIRSSDGIVVKIGDKDTVDITVSAGDLDENGMVELVLLDDEAMPLALVGLQTLDDTGVPGTTDGQNGGGKRVFI